MNICLYVRHIGAEDRPHLDALERALEAVGFGVRQVYDGDSVDGADLLISVGGDGTLLSSVQFVRTANPATFPPILGVNFGHLGFLTTVGKEDPSTLAEHLRNGRFSLEERTLMQVNEDTYALNEVFLHRGEGTSLLRTEVYVDGDYVSTYAGDGLIVATPTGSTAYSLSCGGPILMPNSRGFVITPISAHTLTLRPIIVPDTATILIRPKLRDSASRYTVGIDSRRYSYTSEDTFTLRRAPFTIRLVRMGGQNFFSAIRDKLMWGTEAGA